jgi:hypothetical protein
VRKQKIVSENQRIIKHQEETRAELIKYGGKGMIDAMQKLITMIWITEEMPQS